MDEETIHLINLYISQIKNGKDEFLQPLHKLIGPTLRYIALKYLKNDFDADDAVQDFWLDIHKIASKFVFELNGFSYLCKTMTRKTINKYKKLKKDRYFTVSYVDYSNKESSNQDFDLDTIAIKESVNKAMQTLSHDEQIIIQLTYFEDKTLRQIGKELGISKTQAGRLLIRAREEMKIQLEDLLWDKTNY